MNSIPPTALTSLAVGFLLLTAAPLPADDLSELITKAELVFEDDFNRAEADDSKEQLGKEWVTNSKTRAKGTKQADLVDSYLSITMAKHADHGVSVRHDAPFTVGIVKVRFRMHDKKGIGFNFNDPRCKSSHAGHICHVGVRPGKIDFRDGKTGVFKKETREKRLAGASKEEIAKLTKGTLANVRVNLDLEKWYEMTILIHGDVMTAFIDGKKVGHLKSPGIAHQPKQNIAFAVSGTADVDNLKVWRVK